MGFADELLRRTKSKEQIIEEQRTQLEKRTVNYVEEVLERIRAGCIHEAENGKRKYDYKYTYSWSRGAKSPVDRAKATKMIRDSLDKEGFKWVTVRSREQSDYDGDHQAWIHVIVKW